MPMIISLPITQWPNKNYFFIPFNLIFIFQFYMAHLCSYFREFITCFGDKRLCPIPISYKPSLLLSWVQELLEPFSRFFSDSPQIVFVINEMQTKSRSVSSLPLPIIQQWPHKIAFYITSIFTAMNWPHIN